MATATERIPVLVTPAEKRQISSLAKSAGMSVGEYLRRAAVSFRPAEDDRMLEGMLAQMVKTTARAGAAIDDALSFVAASNKRIRALETKKKRAA